MTDEIDSSVVLAELQVALFRECNTQRLSPWGRPLFCSPDPVKDICTVKIKKKQYTPKKKYSNFPKTGQFGFTMQ